MPLPEGIPAVTQALQTRVDHPWAGFKADKHFFLR
jgi:hypothetical protein